MTECEPGKIEAEIDVPDKIAADIENLAIVVGALEAMTPIGRKAAMAYLMNRYDRM